MTNEELIRKAVELADGWKVSIQDWGYDICGPHPFGAEALCDEIPQPMLDALAAQLTRQVDDIDCDVEISCGEIAVYDPYGSVLQRCDEDGDRTMNTIRAIVDSGVLDE